MKQGLVAILFLLIGGTSWAQPFGNEWINYSQPYYKIKIVNEGIYRLDYSVVSTLPGFPADHRNLQIFGRQQEQYIHIELNGGGAGTAFDDAGDYIEFFAERNDGWFDEQMYPAGKHTNPYFSNYNDTAVYFLTWNASISNKRMTPYSDTNYGAYTLSNYILKKQALYYHNIYTFGEKDIEGNSSPVFSQSEGWGEYEFYNSGGREIQNHFDFDTRSHYAAGPNSIMEIGVSPTSNPAGPNSHHLEIAHDAGTGGGSWTVLMDTIFDGYPFINPVFSIPSTSLGVTQTKAQVATVSSLAASPSDRMALNYVTLKFPKTLDMLGAQSARFWVPDNTAGGQNQAHLRFSNYDANGANVYIYVLQNNQVVRSPVFPDAADFRVLVANTGFDKNCYLLNESQINNVTNIVPVTTTALFTDYEALNPDSAYVIITHKDLWTAAANYKGYRASTGHNTLMADIDELYDQYAAGIMKHGLAIRNFANMMLTQFTTEPQFLLLIGKSVHGVREGTANTIGSRHYLTSYQTNKVPSYGYPQSDILITAGLAGSSAWRPAIATGRISATTEAEVAMYLNKIQEYENYSLYPKHEWMKHVMHFGGGSKANEQALFVSYLKSFQNTIEDTCFGGFVHEHYKNSSLPITINLTDSVKNRINAGVSIMTFFGHASGSGFDQNIDSPDGYNNSGGKYPLIIGNSCFTGDVHQYYGGSTSETFVLHPRGAIGFLANVKAGYAEKLKDYCGILYQNIGSKNYGGYLGVSMQNTIESIYAFDSNSLSAEQTCLLNSLQGDPATVIHSFDEPDFVIERPSVYFEPEDITSDMDSFVVVVNINQFGKAVADTVSVELTRFYPTAGKTTIVTKTIARVGYETQVRFPLAVDGLNATGQNRFTVKVDLPENLVAESDDILNNEVNLTLFITSDRLYPVYPNEFAVIPNNTVTLRASTGDPSAAVRPYRLELDTTDLFNSPLKITTTVSEAGGVIEWTPPITFVDSAVYFWRAAPETAGATGLKWEESSFQYINGKTGWGQAHYFQYRDDDMDGIKYYGWDKADWSDFPDDRKNEVDLGGPAVNELRDFEFFTGTQTLSCNVVGLAGNPNDWSATRYSIGTELKAYNGCGGVPSIHVAIIDPKTLKPWGTRYNGANPNHNFGNLNDENVCGLNQVYNAFYFRVTISANMDSLVSLLNNKIPDGHYILMYSYINGYFFYYNNDLANAFTNLGATVLPPLFGSPPYKSWIFFAKKGDPSSAQEVIVNNPNDVISLEVDLPYSGTTGTIKTPLIGPTSKWGSVHWNSAPSEISSEDTTGFNVYGVDYSGTEVLLGSFDESQGEVLNLDTYVDAATYPYVRLEGDFTDDSTETPAQMKSWHVLYDPVPEAAISYNDGYALEADTISQGQDGSILIAIRNIGDVDMDSLKVDYFIEGSDRKPIKIPYSRQAPLKVGDVLLDTVKFNPSELSGSLKGDLSLFVDVNPWDDSTGRYDQLEQTHFNNYFKTGMHIIGDDVNPILDVTFDGIHILDGDIISPTPEIFITLNDENPFLVLDEAADTSNFQVWLTDPEGVSQRVHFQSASGTIMNFTPAATASDKFLIEWSPTFTTNGVYKMLIHADDNAGNSSGDNPYEIEFEVILESSITEILNYPNPFSTRTQFVFTLTGSKIPDEFRIQIITVTGKVVREIGTDEIGPLNIGRNITNYYWNGTDEYGDQLANGVYLYRTITKIDGEDIDYNSTEAEQFFRRGFGKMYLMR